MIQDREKLIAAAKYVALELKKLPFVKHVAIIGSVARSCKRLEDVKRSSKLEPAWRRKLAKKGIPTFSDLDLAVWVGEGIDLGTARQALITGWKAYLSEHEHGISNNEFDVFLLNCETNEYLGNLCQYRQCPKEGKQDCLVASCGQPEFLKKYQDFILDPSATLKECRIDLA
nr:hypothetical protein [Candidatus Sigynarchaeum springense]